MMFGLRLISKEQLEHLESCEQRVQRMSQVYRWFSGWTDLDIIWEYLRPGDYYGTIETARRKYAQARGTDEYGKPLPPRPEADTEELARLRHERDEIFGVATKRSHEIAEQKLVIADLEAKLREARGGIKLEWPVAVCLGAALLLLLFAAFYGALA